MSYFKLSIAPFVVLEVLASVAFVVGFGFGKFVLFLFASAILGAALLGLFWKNMLAFKISTPLEMLKNFAFVIAGFLLAVPGVLSSICGLCVLVFGLVFTLGRKSANSANFDGNSQNFNANSANFSENSRNFNENSHPNSEIIDVEIIETKKD